MVTRLLCWMILCLLGAGHTDVGVSQSPRYRVTARGQNVTLRCDPISGYNCLYWYQQTLGKGPEFSPYFQNEFVPDNSGLLSDCFSAERPEASLCTKSLATVGHHLLLPAHRAPVLSCPYSSQKLSPRSCPNLPTSKGRNALGTAGAPLTGGQEIAFEISEQVSLDSNNFDLRIFWIVIFSSGFYIWD
ncbi:T-cell receptor beta chain V region CTL-L17 [Tupaia chinensis]|nr:T-cell receptor beta chain V region CTL-L17 [Tupaia chinensis]